MSDEKQFQKVEWSGDQYNPADDDLDELPAPPRRSLPPEDRALLELAARAIGRVRFEEVEGEEYANLHFADGTVLHAWNPLTFSGDALELAVKLHMDVAVCPPGLGWVAVKFHQEPPSFGGYLSEPHGNDVLAATRRAITRAAAEIGKQQ